ncbi:hypothetical protein QTP88_005101 [Uroleucon formosanum]
MWKEILMRKREDWVEYKSVCKIVKSAVSKAKLKRYDELYEGLRTREGEKEIYRLAKVRVKRTRDLQNVWCIKSEDKRILTKEDDVKKRWKKYFESLLNEEYPKESLESIS